MNGNGNGVPTHLSWEIDVPVSGRSDKLLHLTRTELDSIAKQTTEGCIGQISESFGLDGQTVDAMWGRASSLDVIFVSGRDYGEYSQANPERLFVGPARLAIAKTSESESSQDSRTPIYLSIRGINDEIKNLTTAREGLQSMMSDNSDIIKDEGLDRLKELEDPDRCTQTAIALSFARRLLKYGLLPDEAMPKGSSSSYGFSDWLQHCKALSNLNKDFTRKERQMLAGVYESDKQAIKNLRHTVWTELFYKIVGIDPQRDQVFYMLYYTPAIGQNSNHVISFNDVRTCSVNREETSDCLATIFNPAGHKLRSV